MTAFRALLDDLADQAKLYDVTDRAVATARRRRRLQWAVPAVLTLVVIGATAAVWVPTHSKPPASSTVASWLPARIGNPATAPALPDSRVGRGALVYFLSDGPIGSTHGPAVLATTTGAQYRLPDQARPDGSPTATLTPSLSPDGRWLVYQDRGTPYLRDLAGTARRVLTPSLLSSIAWSPNGHWLVYEGSRSLGNIMAGHPVTRFDLRTGTAHTYQLKCCIDANPVSGVRDDGRLVFVTETGGGAGSGQTIETFDVRDVDPAVDQAHLGSITLTMHQGVPASDPGAKWLVYTEYQLAPGGTRLLFLNAGQLTVVDVKTMKVKRVYPVPLSHVPAPPATISQSDVWWQMAYEPQGILLQHQWYAAGQYHTSLELLNLTTGQHHKVTDFAVPAASVILR